MLPILKTKMFMNQVTIDQECLDRLAISLGGNTIVPIASEFLPAYLANPDWLKHHAALITLSQIAEGRYMLSSFMRQRQLQEILHFHLFMLLIS